MVHKTLGFPEPRSRLCQMLDMSMANQKIQGFVGESKSAGFWHKPSRGVVTFIWRWCVDPSSNSKPIENLGFLKAFLVRMCMFSCEEGTEWHWNSCLGQRVVQKKKHKWSNT